MNIDLILISRVCFILAGIFFVLTVFLFFYLDIISMVKRVIEKRKYYNQSESNCQQISVFETSSTFEHENIWEDVAVKSVEENALQHTEILYSKIEEQHTPMENLEKLFGEQNTKISSDSKEQKENQQLVMDEYEFAGTDYIIQKI